MSPLDLTVPPRSPFNLLSRPDRHAARTHANLNSGLGLEPDQPRTTVMPLRSFTSIFHECRKVTSRKVRPSKVFKWTSFLLLFTNLQRWYQPCRLTNRWYSLAAPSALLFCLRPHLDPPTLFASHLRRVVFCYKLIYIDIN